jgi:uncharacterized protein YegL
MSSLLDAVPISRRVMTLFFVVDTSGSMSGAKIASVNQAIREILPILNTISQNNADAEIKIAMLKFSSGVSWMYDSPKDFAEFKFQDLTAGNLTDFGQACQALNEKLSRSAFMQEVNGAYAPVIILLSDGAPTDAWESPMEKLKNNKWFASAIKIAIGIGNDANRDVLTAFTGSQEAVIEVHNVEALKAIIRTVTVTASMIGSNSHNDPEKPKQELVNQKIVEKVATTPGATIAADMPPPMDDNW